MNKSDANYTKSHDKTNEEDTESINPYRSQHNKIYNID